MYYQVIASRKHFNVSISVFTHVSLTIDIDYFLHSLDLPPFTLQVLEGWTLRVQQ